MFEHDFVRYPELRNSELAEFQLASPHIQILNDFLAEVVRVHDGDTITLSVPFRDFLFPLRLADIDAPEMNAGGKTARDWLRSRVLGQTVEVQIDPNNRVDKWGRLMGTVFHGGVDVGQEEVYLGLATPYGELGDEIPNTWKVIPLWP